LQSKRRHADEPIALQRQPVKCVKDFSNSLLFHSPSSSSRYASPSVVRSVLTLRGCLKRQRQSPIGSPLLSALSRSSDHTCHFRFPPTSDPMKNPKNAPTVSPTGFGMREFAVVNAPNSEQQGMHTSRAMKSFSL